MTAQMFELSNGQISAGITDFGASLVSLRLKGWPQDLVLGFPELSDQVADPHYMGAIVGRYANRIAEGRMQIGAKLYQLDRNENGVTHLHGGNAGFARRMWQAAEVSPQRLTLRMESQAGESGYPGALQAEVIYELDGAALRVKLMARSDAETIVNLCHHPYFNLSGATETDAHRLWIAAERYLPTDAAQIPTGEQARVSDTRFDFTTPRAVPMGVFDHTYCLHGEPSGRMAHAATLSAGPRALELWTTQPGLHLYNAAHLVPGPSGHHGQPYGPYSAICLEAQGWPDSPNHPDFPSTKLRPGDTYRQVTEYRLS
ncbi:aldose epimerase family protein [Gymnodinialimonas sp. 2305UL16-5]|uniref:aldose epimerase family protein n=1 Tax=Gymnodinialimonas mytili TaxID=3126503 RepID=UPI00309D5AFE